MTEETQTDTPTETPVDDTAVETTAADEIAADENAAQPEAAVDAAAAVVNPVEEAPAEEISAAAPATEAEATDTAASDREAAQSQPTSEQPAESVAAEPVEPAAAEPAAESAPSAEESATAEPSSGEPPAAPKPREISVVKMNTGLDDLPDDLSPEDFESAIAQTVLEFKEGDLIEGTIVRIDHDEVLVDIGYKSEGVIPANELSIRNNANPADVVEPGEVVEAMVLEMEDSEGRLILSKKRALYERAWGTIEQIMHQNGTVKGPVIEVVKGGLIVDIGLRGFLPASLVELRRVRDLQPYVGEEIEAKVIELDKNRNNVVLSRRAYLEDEQAEQRHAFLGDLAEGDIRDGVVSSVVNFGAFVDLGGMDGLVHVSELSWQHVTHPSEVVNVGDKVSVKVLEVDRDRERISLSIRQTRDDPWATFAESNGVGSILEGKVTKTVPFGAFVSVNDGVEGLVHVSEIAMHHVESPELELSVDQEVKVRITEIDPERRRISLSIKQAMPEWQDRQQSQGQPRPQKKRQERSRDYTTQTEEETSDRSPHFTADASLEAILQELKEKGIGN